MRLKLGLLLMAGIIGFSSPALARCSSWKLIGSQIFASACPFKNSVKISAKLNGKPIAQAYQLDKGKDYAGKMLDFAFYEMAFVYKRERFRYQLASGGEYRDHVVMEKCAWKPEQGETLTLDGQNRASTATLRSAAWRGCSDWQTLGKIEYR